MVCSTSSIFRGFFAKSSKDKKGGNLWITWQSEDNDTDINHIYADVLSAVNVSYTIKVAVDD